MKRVRHSLQTLRIFSAVAEAGGISSAAARLGLTQSAVTKHMQALEESLGVNLMERSAQGVALTPAGARYLNAVRRALQILDEAALRLAPASDDVQEVCVGVAPAVAQRWLIPRLDDFAAQHPGVRIKLVPRPKEERAQVPPGYAEIRVGTGRFAGWSARYLLGRDYRFVLGAAQQRKLTAQGIATHQVNRKLLEVVPLLGHQLGPAIWDDALAALALRVKRAATERIAYEQYSVLIPAAVAGQGMGLVPSFLVADELRSGQLVTVGEPVRSSMSFYLLTPRGKPRSPALELFADWVARQAAQTKVEK